MEDQEVQQLAVSVAEFDILTDEFKGLIQMMTTMMRTLESNPAQPVVQDSGSGSTFPRPESLHSQVQNITNPSVQFHIPQPIPILEHVEILHYKGGGAGKTTKANETLIR